MKKILLILLILGCSAFVNATVYVIVVYKTPPPMLNLCPGDTLRFVGDSLNQNAYGSIMCGTFNVNSSLNSTGAVISYTNVATAFDHILIAGIITMNSLRVY